jgi:hypothetical protein
MNSAFIRIYAAPGILSLLFILVSSAIAAPAQLEGNRPATFPVPAVQGAQTKIKSPVIQNMPAIPVAAGQPPASGEIKYCKSRNECPTKECWDGVCCKQSCMGNCVSCALPGHEGTCTPVPDGLDPRRACTISQGGHPACNTACYSGQCKWPDAGTPCELCMLCNGTGRCTIIAEDDPRCGVIQCKGLDSPCRQYHDLSANRCDGPNVCKTANNPLTCTQYVDFYSAVDANKVRYECATGKVMNCYRTHDNRWVWQDGAVIKSCSTGAVCPSCPPPDPKKPEDWVPPKFR